MKSEIVVSNGKAYHIGVAQHQMAPRIFQVGDPDRAYKVAKRFDCIHHECKNREFVTLTGKLDGKPVSVMGTGIGHDNVEIALLEAYTLLAFDLQSQTLKDDVPDVTVLRIGTSGGAQGDVDPGTLGITSYAIGLDTTGIYWDVPVPDETSAKLEKRAKTLLDEATAQGSRFQGWILPYAAKATPEIVALLSEVAGQIAPTIPNTTGVTVAAPGFYGASGRHLEGLKLTVPGIKLATAAIEADGHRVINFEMESSLIFLLAQGLGWQTGTICPIISNPKRQDVVLDYRPYVDAAIDIAIETMRRI
jgi:uridine phosphorylase